MLASQGREPIRADTCVDRRLRLRLGKLPGPPGQAVAAVPARLLSRLAEVTDESAHLAAVVGDKRKDARDAGDLRLFSASEAFQQAVDELGPGGRKGKERGA